MKIESLGPCGVELKGFPRKPSEADFQEFEGAFRKHSLVLIRDPEMTLDDHIAILSRLGEVTRERFGGDLYQDLHHNPKDYDDSFGKLFARRELAFHFDYSASDNWPYKVISLFAHEVPEEGGETRYCHTGNAYDHIDEDLKKELEGKMAVHILDPYVDAETIRPREATVGKYVDRGVHEIIRDHPFADRKTLTVTWSNTDRVVGLPHEESEQLLDQAFKAIYSPRFVYTHKWQSGDLMIWDNRVVQHARNTFNLTQERRLRRMVIGDTVTLQHLYRRWDTQVPVQTVVEVANTVDA